MSIEDAIQFADDRPTSCDEVLYQWAVDAEEVIRKLAALVEAQQPTTHVPNPAEIEHVAVDVSKNGAELNMSTQQPAPSKEVRQGAYETGWKDGYKHGAWSAQQPAPAGAAVWQGGWAWVPVEPSTAMLVAGNHGQPGDFSASKVWHDMLDALQRSHDYTRPVDPPSAMTVPEKAGAPLGMYEHQCPNVTGHRGPAFVCQQAGHAVGQHSYCKDCPTPQPAPATQQAGEVRRAELVPGVMHCAKCKFQLNRVTLCVSDGNAYAGNNKTEPCPNGCGPLWPVTWEQEAKNCWKALEEMHERLMAAAAPQPTPTPQADSHPAPVLLSDEELCQIEEPYLLNFRIPLGGQYDFARAVEKAVICKMGKAHAPQGETNVQLDIDSNHSAPGQQWNVAGAVALGQPVGDGPNQVAGRGGAADG